MAPIRRLARQGSAVALTTFLVVSSRTALARPDAHEIAKRWRDRPPLRIADLRRKLAGTNPAELAKTWATRRKAHRPHLTAPAFGVPGLARRYHAGGLIVPEPQPINPLLDPLGLFGDETGEQPPVSVAPRLFFADWDGDGDLDAFVGDKYGYVRYLQNDPTPDGKPHYTELTGAASPTGSLDLSFDATDPMDTIPFGPSAPTLVDIDGDNDLDLFVGQGLPSGPSPGGRVLFFRNDGGTLVRDDADNPLDGFVFGFAGATPNFVDIDKDGDFDVFVGTKFKTTPSPDGEVFFLRNDGDKFVPAFSDQTKVAGTDPFATEAFFPVTAPFFADVDGDGDQDAFIGDYYQTHFFRNDTVLPGPPNFVEETGYDNPLAGELGLFSGPALADVDGDGDLDAFIGLGFGKYYGNGFIQYVENTGTKYEPAFLSTGDRLELVDVDGDGDLDALVSHLGYSSVIDEPPEIELGVWYFRNTGSQSQPRWELQSESDNPFFTFNAGYSYSGPSPYLPSLAPTVGHLDGDPLLDAFVGEPDGHLEFLEDDGSGQLDPAATHALEGVDFGSDVDPHFADVNGDGELDLVVGYAKYIPGSMGDYTAQVAFFLNPTGPAGLGTTPDFVLDFTGQLSRPAPTLADVDGDGDLDLLVGGSYAGDTGIGFATAATKATSTYAQTLFVENTGTKTAPSFDASTAVPVEALVNRPTSPAMGDVNGDGSLDLFLGTTSGPEVFLTAPYLEAVKQVTGGDLQPGNTVEYTLTVTNTGTGTQPDNPSDPELTDTLPAGLTLVSADLVSGPGTVSTSGNTVRWDGALDPGESASILITATIGPDLLGTTVLNQATAYTDHDLNGTNETPVLSDDPTTPAPNDPTAFVVGTSIVKIPALSAWGAGLFAGLLGLLGLFGLKRSGS